LALAVSAGIAHAEDETPTKSTATSTTSTAVVTPCVATSTSGAFYDLRQDTAVWVAEGDTPPRGARTEDYLARGYDYGYNFTLNICGAVVKGVDDVVGVEKSLWRNVSAYYEHKGKIFSIG